VLAELEELEAAIAGARIAIDTVRFAAFESRADDIDLREVPGGVPATLTLVGQCVRQLQRVITGEVPASALVSHCNVVDEQMARERRDLLIPIERTK
jgi:hypothetical protein